MSLLVHRLAYSVCIVRLGFTTYYDPNHFGTFLDDKSHSRVLLTHIPLYRRDNTYCGPDRSSPVINQVLLFVSYSVNLVKHIVCCFESIIQ